MNVANVATSILLDAIQKYGKCVLQQQLTPESVVKAMSFLLMGTLVFDLKRPIKMDKNALPKKTPILTSRLFFVDSC